MGCGRGREGLGLLLSRAPSGGDGGDGGGGGAEEGLRDG